ncbi:hypothetical protein [Sphingomonas baiyangensis]|uniref:Uncharacterized protein n=1 Tax=Sphingomonas baiyangensis TaxID=2572576 RepID=A0A4U1L6X4_9SPHN|nr:hypothetical protein [Sphingomonas baiyangensis]TKD52060.1 hypothetical protein FBR43_15955 [Sphingomonas baiyangensis]
MSHIIPFPARRSDRHGTVHVFGDRIEGFTVSHESASGDSWGGAIGPFDRGQDAIAAAYALNRDEYGGQCDVFICDAARTDACPDVGFATYPGEF